MRPFRELGAVVENRWRKQNYSEELFPEIAARALYESDLIEKVDPWEIIRWVHTTTDLPQQQDRNAKFGNPPITLFAGSRFYIDVYFWLDGTTAIHQHSFSGAFQVLLGSSVHSHYHFEREREINPHFLIGNLNLEDVSLLTRGNIKEIRPGPNFIHSLFHLERPSATITVRSNHAPHAAVQYSYLRPHLALDPFFEEDSLSKKAQTVSLLLSMKHREADRFIIELLDDADFHTTFCVLNVAFDFLGNNELEELFQLGKSRERFDVMLERARQRHGDIADLLPPVFAEQRRQADITKRRAMIEGEDHRFFLALLLNVPQRDTVLRLIKQRFPDADPVDLATGWIEELTAIRSFGSHEPNVLGLKDFDKTHLAVLAGLLRGLPEKVLETQTSAQLSSKMSFADVVKNFKAASLFRSIFSTQTSDPQLLT